jgi:hypothetical protein
MFRKLDLFPCSGEGKKTPTLLGPLERADPLRLPNRGLPPSLPSPENWNRSSLETLRLLVIWNSGRWTKSRTQCFWMLYTTFRTLQDLLTGFYFLRISFISTSVENSVDLTQGCYILASYRVHEIYFIPSPQKEVWIHHIFVASYNTFQLTKPSFSISILHTTDTYRQT